jgi:hypothetical protein
MIIATILVATISAWVPFSKEYDALWSDRAKADQEIDAMAREHIGTVYLTLSGSASEKGLKQLADRRDPFTQRLQYVLNALAAHQIAGCAAILSDNFTGSAKQMARDAAIDPILDFNRSAGHGDARFVCASTDLEMTAGSRTARIYDLWKSFHAALRQRVARQGGGLAIVAWVQGPDYLIAKLAPDDRAALMTREGITRDPSDTSLYDGALRYLTTLHGQPVVDAVIPMWYFTPATAYTARVDHNLRELRALRIPDLHLIAGIMVRNQRAGLCCPGCVAGRADYDARIAADAHRHDEDPSFTGTAVFLWPIPAEWRCAAPAG